MAKIKTSWSKTPLLTLISLFLFTSCAGLLDRLSNSKRIPVSDQVTAKKIVVKKEDETYKDEWKDDFDYLFKDSKTAYQPVKRVVVTSLPKSRQADEILGEINPQLNRKVKWWINYYTTRERRGFQRYLNRGHRYKKIVENVLSEYKLPAELYYLAMIESGYSLRAHSKAKAAGVWQFIAGTAKRYGLKMNRGVDERYDPIRSTQAAAKYLRDLYNAFHSWELALSAYNCGEVCVLRAIMRADTRNFWTLGEKRRLPKETLDYVPKFLAAVTIGKNPAKYGFKVSSKITPLDHVASVKGGRGKRLSRIARKFGISYSQLQKLNPHLRRGRTPGRKNHGNYQIWIPQNKIARYQGRKKQLVTAIPKPPVRKLDHTKTKHRMVSRTTNQKYYKYQIKRGDTLSSIARQFKISVAKIKKTNRIRGNRIIAGKKINIPSKSYLQYRRYRVQAGDNLSRIAALFNTSITRIKKLNALKSNRIYVNQVLSI